MADQAKETGFDLDRLDLIIFDFDGTLAELNIDFVGMKKDVADLAAEYGMDLEATGKTYTLEAVAELIRLRPEVEPEFSRRAEEAIVRCEVAAARQGRLFPGVREGLSRLDGLGFKLAVITRNCRPAVETVFPDIEACCHFFVPREDAPRPKPHPEHLGLVFDSLGVEPQRSLVVGDHPMDIVTARRAGAWACGVTTGIVGAEGLAQADLVFNSLIEVVEAVAQVREEG